MNPLLEIRDLKMRLGAFRLGPIDLALRTGDYMVLLGPSGCGKTTLLRCVAGMHRSLPERLFLAGSDMAGVPPHRRHVSYVSQTTDLFPHLTVERNIAFGLAYLKLPRRERRARVARMADLLGLAALLDRNVTALSGGESKRVALARGLVVSPRMLLLDEPLSGVDHHARSGMFEILKMIHDELGTATLHVTHDREEAWAVARQCAVMRDGRVEQSGTLRELVDAPASPFVERFLGGFRRAVT